MVLTTHYMEEAAHLCDRLVVMDKGRILTEGRPEDLVARHIGREVVEIRVGGGVLELAERPAPDLRDSGISQIFFPSMYQICLTFIGAAPQARRVQQ